MTARRITAIIVTYNRRTLLHRCLTAIASQTYKLNRVLVIDNASTDDTRDWLKSWLPVNLPQSRLIAIPSNTGGAGGFATGMQTALLDEDCDWVWMMDDDAEPAHDALSVLVDTLDDDASIYGSIATPGNGSLCWPLFSTSGLEFNALSDIPSKVEVAALPFLGILVPRTAINAIGLPDASYFIAGDDTEFCFRARKNGIPIIAVGNSHLIHPPSEYYRFGFGAFSPVCFRIAPWKRYYDVRNRILTSSKLGTFHVWTKTLPATALRLTATLVHEPNRWEQFRAYYAGVFDGLRGLKGQRHLHWKLGA